MKKIILGIFLFFFLLIIISPVSAQIVKDSKETDTGGVVKITNPLDPKGDGSGINTPQKFIGRVISGLLGVIGSIALVMFVLGGFTWMTSAGDKTKVTKGRDTMLWAVLGLTVVFSSYALVKFVIEKVAG